MTSSATCLHVAGERLSLHAGTGPWEPVLAARYPGFVERDPCADAFRIELCERGDPMGEPRFVAPADARAAVDVDGTRVNVSLEPFAFELDLARRRGRAYGPAHRVTVDMLVHLALPLLLAGDGLVLHGAFLAEETRAWICAGPSGAGKSTLAGLLPGRAMCDELSALRGAAGAFTAHALPFWRGRPAQRPLAGIHLLRHAPEHARRRLDPGKALPRLAAEVRWPCVPSLAQQALATLETLVASVPVFDLGFRPEAGVWDVIEAGGTAA